jgi:hypothetical protein
VAGECAHCMRIPDSWILDNQEFTVYCEQCDTKLAGSAYALLHWCASQAIKVNMYDKHEDAVKL